MKKIVLKGYYGKGNLGDDILMIVTFRLVKELFPGSEILICSDGYQSAYIKNLVGDVAIIKSNTPIKVDYIIHGGGGVYFDFKKGNLKLQLINFFIRLVSYSMYKKIYRTFQRWRNNEGITSKFRLGFGIGIGTYTASSRKFYADILSLSDYNYLIVRDEDSLSHVKKFKFAYPVTLATDIAFLHEYWNPEKKYAKGDSGKRIGFILRDWSLDQHTHVSTLFEVAVDLEAQGYEIVVFSLDQFEDGFFLRKFSTFKFISWNPSNTTLNEFLDHVSKIDLVVSSRAHGCIISACLGIPSLILGIEPKLGKISRMLQFSSSYLSAPFDKESIVQAILQGLTESEQKRRLVAVDVKRNADIMRGGIERLQHFISRSSA